MLRAYGWSAFVGEIESQMRQALSAAGGGAGWPAETVEQFSGNAATLAPLFPAVLAICAIAAGVLADAIVGRLGLRRGEAPLPFGDFSFNDQWIWGVVATLAVLVLSTPAWIGALAMNLVLVWAAMYIVRGLAVVAARMSNWRPASRVALSVAGLVLLPYALGSVLVLGIADTWINLRRTQVGPDSEGDAK
jgi:hypothetical protein